MDRKGMKEEIEQYINNLKIAIDAFKLHNSIMETIIKYNNEINCMTNFIVTIVKSLQITFIMETYKLVDKDGQKSIFKLLNVCEQNKDAFPKEKIMNFIYENDKKEKITKNINIQDDINKIRDKIKQYNGLIQNLKGARDKYYAHTDKKYFYDVKKLFQDYRISIKDFEMLLNTLSEILNLLLIDLCGEGYVFNELYINEFERILKRLRNCEQNN